MTVPSEFETPLPVPPECGPTTDRIQAVLDGELPPGALDADPHPAACRTCRERVRAARLVLAALAEPPAVPVPPGLTGAILAGVRADRRARARRRVLALAGGLAAAAAVVVAVWVWPRPEQPAVADRTPVPPAQVPVPVPPAPEPVPPQPGQPPLRINQELARAGDALQEESRNLTEPMTAGPKVFASLTESLLKPSAAPFAPDMGPARDSLADLPAAARTGLEPVTGSAQKAFDRLLRDVSAVQPGKPKS